MKKFVLAFIVLTVIGVTVLYGINRGPSGPTMDYPEDLAMAIDLMEGLQSRVITPGNQSAVTESEIIALGRDFLMIKDSFSHNNDRIEVLTKDRAYFEDLLRNKLGNIASDLHKIDDFVSESKRPAFFINAFSDYRTIARSQAVSILEVTDEGLPGNGDNIWKWLFEITKDTREIIARLRGNDWLSNYKSKLCVSDDATNDTYTSGSVRTIAFSKNQDGSITYNTIASHPDVCLPPPPGHTEQMLEQYVCMDNQLEDQTVATECEYGCQNGACLPKPEVAPKLSHFQLCKQDEEHLPTDSPPDEQEIHFDLGVIARNSDNTIAEDYSGNGLIIVTGDNDATYPEQTDLTLTGGIKFFPMILTKTQSTFGQPVTVSYKDPHSFINGGGSFADLTLCRHVEDLTLCPDVKNEVCAGKEVQCVDEPCLLDYQTYNNECEAKRAGAVKVFPGKCAKDNEDDCSESGSCEDVTTGCTDEGANNYDPTAQEENGTCQYDSDGCTDASAHNYNYEATVDDGSCETCSDGEKNGDEEGGGDCGGMMCSECEGVCTDDKASNYVGYSEQEIEDEPKLGKKSDQTVCEYKGCTDSSANNYNPDAIEDDGSCEYDPEIYDPIYFCDSQDAVNFDEDAGNGMTHADMYQEYQDALNNDEQSEYEPDIGMCNFCGDGDQQGEMDSEGFISGEQSPAGTWSGSIELYESCDQGDDSLEENDVPYDGCFECQVEWCGTEQSLCEELGIEGMSDVAGKTSAGVDFELNGQIVKVGKGRTWSDNTAVNTTKDQYRDYVTFGPVCIEDEGEKITEYVGVGTTFGHNDNMDNGWGGLVWGTNICSGCDIFYYAGGTTRVDTGLKTRGSNSQSNGGELPTNNTKIRGVALPSKLVGHVFGTSIKWRALRVHAYKLDANGNKIEGSCREYPVVDSGPNEKKWAAECTGVLDFTAAAAAEMDVSGVTKNIGWEIVQDGGDDHRDFETDGNSAELPEEYFVETSC